jgi:hypothetical protein
MIAALAAPELWAQRDDTLARALARVAAEAGRFSRNATRFTAEETLRQKAVIEPKTPRVRIAGVRQKPPRITLEARDIVSYYGFAPLNAAGARGLHEVRRIVSVDAKPRPDAANGRAALVFALLSPDERERDRLRKEFDQAGLAGQAADFGQVLMLFTEANQNRFSYELGDPGRIGAESTMTIAFRQRGGDQALRLNEGGKKDHAPLEGEIWVSESDYEPLRVTLRATRKKGRQEIRDDARVDYAPLATGELLPVSITHRRFLNDETIMENISQLADWRPLR